MEKISAPRGTKDVLPNEVHKWHYLENKLRDVARRSGFHEIRFPTFEDINLFRRGVGDTTDVVQKEMYDFNDKGGRHIALRPEGTASVVRSVIENGLDKQGLPIKVYYIAPNFRYEKPQAGRLREHHQFGIECFGSYDAGADAEVIGVADMMLRELGIKDVSLHINSCGCPKCRPRYHEALKAYFSEREGELCAMCRDRLTRNPMRILDCKSAVCHDIAKDAPDISDFWCDECTAHFNKLKKSLDACGIKYVIDTRIVRGLDYYTNTVFEFIVGGIGAQSTICGGGRYNGLVETLGGQETAGLGFGSGLERLLLTMEAQGIEIPNNDVPDTFIAAMGAAASECAETLTFKLRGMGIAAERDTLARSLKAQMKYASKIGARTSIVIGDDEITAGRIIIKNMDNGEKTECALDACAIADVIGGAKHGEY
ncbi:MAG: histidine--tRNA ligase [Clostridia bacterium]